MDEFKTMFSVMTFEEQFELCRQTLYSWYTGLSCLLTLVLEVLVVVDIFCDVDVPRWLYVALGVLVLWNFLHQRAWAINNGMGCLNLLFYPMFLRPRL